MRNLLGYALWQLPGQIAAAVVAWLLVRWDWLPVGWAVALIVVWVAKDYALYPLYRPTFRRSRVGVESLLGARATVTVTLAPQGEVQVGGERWRAESATAEALPAGAPVVVREVRGLTLLVERDTAALPRSRP